MKMQLITRAIGTPLNRIDGVQKVTGAAKYAYEYPVEGMTYVFPVQSTIARGRVVSIDASAARALPGVVTVLSHENAPRVAPTGSMGVDADLAVLQSDAVAYHGQFVAAVVAETSEIARQAASLVTVRYEEQPHDVELRADRGDLYKPARFVTGDEPDTESGDVDAALTSAAVSLDQVYTTPPYHNNPLEPHATTAIWSDEGVILYDANQGADSIRDAVATAFRLPPERVRVIARYVGGGFGSKAFPHPHVILTMMAAQAAGRPVKFALTRQQMFVLAGYRTPTIQRIRLGADRDGRLTAIAHDVVEQTSTIYEFAEPTAVVTRTMYAAPNRRTTHRLARLDMPVPTWMRAPGECPGMFALESAMDELAIACGLDPIELRIRNEPAVDPETSHPFSSRGLVACLREGAQRFGWAQRDPQPRARRDGSWLIGTGVAASTFPAIQFPANARVGVDRAGRYRVSIAASDIGTGAWTVLTQIAADALEVPPERVHLEIGDSSLPKAFVAGGSSGTASWGWAIFNAASALRARLRKEYGGSVPAGELEATGAFETNPEAQQFSMHAFGAQFAEVRVNVDTGEIRVPRLLGVFAAGRIINPKTARSQFLGGMTMGLSMALHEASVLDPRFGDFVNHDFAEYHIATNADVGTVDVTWIDEEDPHVNPMGTKGIGEIGIVGTAAAIANAVYHAIGIRIRDLPITLDKMLP
ncbi:MAG TPA: xanthine dehydrogenase family protein molybdopterin-binding subunit [Ktedonobacteraceae bacterium]